MGMLNSQKKKIAILSPLPLPFEMSGVAYLDLFILYIHFWMSHRRNHCHISININIILLETAQAAKKHNVSEGSILTHQLVNSRAQLQSQSQRLHCTGHCSLADSLQTWPFSSSAPSPYPGWAQIQQLPVTRPSPSVSRSAAGQHHDSTPSTSPSLLYDPAASLHWRVVKKPEKARGFSVLLIRVYKSSVNRVHPLPSKQCLKEWKIDLHPCAEKLYLLLLLHLRLKYSNSMTTKQTNDTAVSLFWSGLPFFFFLWSHFLI